MRTVICYKPPAAPAILRRALAGLLLVLCSATGGLAADAESTFFGTVADVDAIDVGVLREQLHAVAANCTQIEKKCSQADELIATVLGGITISNLPIQIIYIDDDLEVVVNKLFWKHKLTPYVLGSQNVTLIVFTERPMPLEARLTEIYNVRKGINEALENVFVSEGRRALDALEANQQARELAFEKIGNDETGDAVWVGWSHFLVEPVSAYRLSVLPKRDISGPQRGFAEIRSQFTDSSSNNVDFGIAAGITFNVDEDSQISGVEAGDANLNLYVMIHIYLKKAVLVWPIAEKRGGRYRSSLGISFGTNITFWDAEEFIVAFNWGHLFGRHGIVVGVNFIDPSDGTEESFVRPYFGFEFKF